MELCLKYPDLPDAHHQTGRLPIALQKSAYRHSYMKSAGGQSGLTATVLCTGKNIGHLADAMYEGHILKG